MAASRQYLSAVAELRKNMMVRRCVWPGIDGEHFAGALGGSMETNIYVGNLPFSASEDQIRQMFETYGQVASVKLINDRETGRPRGFGFVEMDEEGAKQAIQALNGSDFGGRTMKVNEARPRERRERW